MHQVKMFTNREPDELEEAINAWLKEHHSFAVHIQYAVYVDGGTIVHSAMVIYLTPQTQEG